jgi:hypothetical protein
MGLVLATSRATIAAAKPDFGPDVLGFDSSTPATNATRNRWFGESTAGGLGRNGESGNVMNKPGTSTTPNERGTPKVTIFPYQRKGDP